MYVDPVQCLISCLSMCWGGVWSLESRLVYIPSYYNGSTLHSHYIFFQIIIVVRNV